MEELLAGGGLAWNACRAWRGVMLSVPSDPPSTAAALPLLC